MFERARKGEGTAALERWPLDLIGAGLESYKCRIIELHEFIVFLDSVFPTL